MRNAITAERPAIMFATAVVVTAIACFFYAIAAKGIPAKDALLISAIAAAFEMLSGLAVYCRTPR
jgi:drug/metabolite transporter (DMT)-like permease